MLKKISRYAGVALAVFAWTAFAIASAGKIQAEEVKEVQTPAPTPTPPGTELWQDSSRIKKSGNYEYHILSEKAKMVSIRKIDNKSEKIVIPETIDGYKVVGIGRSITLPQCLKIEGVGYIHELDEFGSSLRVLTDLSKKNSELTVPSSVCFIGDNAFINCKYLKKVTFKKRKESLEINLGAFEGCKSLKNLEIPKNIFFTDDTESNNLGAFAKCGTLESVKVGSSIYGIESIFLKTKIKKMTVSKDVKAIYFDSINSKSNNFAINKLCIKGKNTKILNVKKGFDKVKTLITVKGAKAISVARKNKLPYQVGNKHYKYEKKKKKWTIHVKKDPGRSK